MLQCQITAHEQGVGLHFPLYNEDATRNVIDVMLSGGNLPLHPTQDAGLLTYMKITDRIIVIMFQHNSILYVIGSTCSYLFLSLPMTDR